MQVSPPGPACETVADGLLAEPVSAVTSLAFVVAGAVILVRRRDRLRLGFAALVAGIGIGSVVQHGPDPVWSDVAHDLPLLATIAFVGADGAADLLDRRRHWWWWVAPAVLLLVVVAAAPRAGDLAQVALAVVAVAVTLVRGGFRRAVRRRIATVLLLLAVGGAVGRLSRAGGPLCDPASLVQGHAVWHLLAATALVVLAPVLGTGSGDRVAEVSAGGAASSAADGRRGRPPRGTPAR